MSPDVYSNKNPQPARCPGCRALLDGYTGVSLAPERRPAPKPGDATICAYCGLYAIFGDDLQLREATASEILDIRQSFVGNLMERAFHRMRAAKRKIN
jgi:hypothetical protein